MPKIKTDYLIIGAGLAGSACAYLLQKAGKDVMLVERLDLGRKAKLCAGLVTPRAQRMLAQLFGESANIIYRSDFAFMRCIAASNVVDLHDISMKSVERAELDAFVLQAYMDRGGKVLDRMHIRAYDFAHNTLAGIYEGRGEDTFEFSYQTLIVADGALSPARKALTGAAPDAILALEATVENVGAPLTMSYEDGFTGYSWYAPVGRKAKVGCCAYVGEPDLNVQLDRFAACMGVKYGRRRGAYIPTGSDVLLERDGVYFLGDAASLICPPSGEGIYYALLSAQRLAYALLNNVSYSTLMRRHVWTIARQRQMRDLFFNTQFMTHGINLAKATPYGAERAVKFALKHFAGYA